MCKLYKLKNSCYYVGADEQQQTHVYTKLPIGYEEITDDITSVEELKTLCRDLIITLLSAKEENDRLRVALSDDVFGSILKMQQGSI